MATVQLAWGAAVLARESRKLYAGGAAGNAILLVVWAVSRTVGLPFGPEAGTPEPVGLSDGLATAYEVVIVAGSMYSLEAVSAIRERWAAVRVGSRNAILVYVLPGFAFLAGGHDAGLGLVPHVDVHLGHHFLHLVFFGGASLVFAVYVTFLVRENGWPRFSWRLDPTSERL